MDEVFRSDLHYQDHSGELTHNLSQPTEKLILARNAELRKNPGVIQDIGKQSGGVFGRQVASIPFITFEQAIRDGYELNCPDAEIQAKEMNRFLQSENGKQCLVQGS